METENSTGSGDLSAAVRSLHRELKQCFKLEKWKPLDHALVRLIALGESEGQKQLCLTSQSFREMLKRIEDASEERRQEAFEQLLFHVTHFQWRCRVRRRNVNSSSAAL